MATSVFIIAALYLTACVLGTSPETERLVNSPGHLKPIGVGRPIHDAEQIEGFPYPKWFFENHVKGSKPLLMKNAAKLSPAFQKWTDDYFLKQDEPAGHSVSVELKKKENRTFGVDEYSFKRFVRAYNTSDIYMVNAVPSFIASDVILPGPLQCQPMMEKILVDNVMWYSSGGTKSVVHTDSVDNINCLFRGTKELLFVPNEFADDVDIDHPEGAYSDIDVDKVDFTKYPGMADVEYLKVNMEPGDCLYIPYKWVHQVRSFDSNLAVNVWWDYYGGLQVDLDHCPDVFDETITIDKLEFKGFGESEMSIPAMKEHFADHAKKAPLSFDQTVSMLLGSTKELNKMDPAKNYEHMMRKIFLLIDQNRNNKIEFDEVMDTEDETWEEVMDGMEEFDNMVAAVEKKYQEMHNRDEPDERHVEL